MMQSAHVTRSVKAVKSKKSSCVAAQQHKSFFCSLLLFIALAGCQGCLCSGQPGNGDAEGRTTHIVESDCMEELDAVGVATMLATDAQFQVRVPLASFLNRHAY